MTTNTSLAGGPTTRRRRVSSTGFKVFTYGALVLIIAPAAWILLGVLFPAPGPLALERAVDSAHRRPAAGCGTRSSAPCSSWRAS